MWSISAKWDVNCLLFHVNVDVNGDKVVLHKKIRDSHSNLASFSVEMIASAVCDAYWDIFRRLKIKMSALKRSHICELTLMGTEKEKSVDKSCRSVSGHKIGSLCTLLVQLILAAAWLNLFYANDHQLFQPIRHTANNQVAAVKK